MIVVLFLDVEELDLMRNGYIYIYRINVNYASQEKVSGSTTAGGDDSKVSFWFLSGRFTNNYLVMTKDFLLKDY